MGRKVVWRGRASGVGRVGQAAGGTRRVKAGQAASDRGVAGQVLRAGWGQAWQDKVGVADGESVA